MLKTSRRVCVCVSIYTCTYVTTNSRRGGSKIKLQGVAPVKPKNNALFVIIEMGIHICSCMRVYNCICILHYSHVPS